MQRTVYLYPKSNYGSSDIDVLEYAKRFGEHMIAVRIQQWRAHKISKEAFMQDLVDLIGRNGDALINTETE